MLSHSFCLHVLLGCGRVLSPLNAASDNYTQYGDHSRQVELLPHVHISPQLQPSFADRGDAFHMFNDASHELKSPNTVSSASFIGHVTEVGIPTVLSEKGCRSLDVFSSKPVQQPHVMESVSFPAVQSHDKYESDTDQTLSYVTAVSQTTQNTLPMTVSSTIKHLNWETLFMPYRSDDAVQTLKPVPVTVAKETGNQAPDNLATLREGYSQTCIMKQWSESDVRPDCVDDTSVDNTSLWVMPCEIFMTVSVDYGVYFCFYT